MAQQQEQISIVSIIVIALFAIFIFSTILQGISFVINPVKDMVSSASSPQVSMDFSYLSGPLRSL